MLTIEQIKEIAELNGIGIIENATQEELDEQSKSLMQSIADITDPEHNLCKHCTCKDSCNGNTFECAICNSSNK